MNRCICVSLSEADVLPKFNWRICYFGTLRSYLVLLKVGIHVLQGWFKVYFSFLSPMLRAIQAWVFIFPRYGCFANGGTPCSLAGLQFTNPTKTDDFLVYPYFSLNQGSKAVATVLGKHKHVMK